MKPSTVFTRDATSDVRAPTNQEPDPGPGPSTSAASGPEQQVPQATTTQDISDMVVLSQPMTEQLASTIVPMKENDMPVFSNRMLHQFEAIFLTESQKALFEKMFHEKKFDDRNTLFQSWLPMKRAVIEFHSPKEIPQQKKTSKSGVTSGSGSIQSNIGGVEGDHGKQRKAKGIKS